MRVKQQLNFFNTKPPKLVANNHGFLREPYLTTDRGVLFNADCLEVLTTIKSETIHCVFADPPFNLGKEYKNGLSDLLEQEAYLNWTRSWLQEAIRILTPGGSLFVYNIPKWLIYISSFLMDKMTFRHWIAITMKNTYPRGNNLYPAHYGLLYFTKGTPRVFNKLRVPIPICRHCGKEIKDYGGHRHKLNDAGLNLTDFWEDTSPVRHNKFKTRVSNELKPMIPERAILMSTNPNDIVLDPFGGGGTTFQIAEKYQRYWIGMEIGSCEPIVERLQYFVNAKFGHPNNEALEACFENQEQTDETNAKSQTILTYTIREPHKQIVDRKTKLKKKKKITKSRSSARST
jgi:site-specific DNA-methyltransferase (adenine-specific)